MTAFGVASDENKVELSFALLMLLCTAVRSNCDDVALLDSGASHNFISRAKAVKFGAKIKNEESLKVNLANKL